MDMMSPRILTYRFHEFRPSDRSALKEVLATAGGQGAFISALEIYLRKWAAANWLTDYDLTRIAKWTSAHFPDVAREVEVMVNRQLAGAQNEQAKKTYAVMSGAIRKSLSLAAA